MIIKKRRIRDIESNLPAVKDGQKIIIGVKNLDDKKVQLKRVGFESIDIGTSVLPSPVFGPVSRFNANGKNLVHKDKPKETAYRTIEWHWKQWHGKDTIDMSKLVDVPYKRYPRSFVAPPSVELKLTTSTKREVLLVTPMYTMGSEVGALLHAINLLLEIFGECYVYTEDLDEIIKTETVRLNWKILPEGKRPWQQLKNELNPVISKARKGKRKFIEKRLETINAFEPEFTAVGTAGFAGYIIMGFPSSDVFVLESLYYGNATYVLGTNWESISKFTKAEILNENLHKDRIIHRVSWFDKIKSVFK
ncbi:hypothetical protein HYV71_04250 [Candidatus Uhrbacteria bacterium]|nr:hypothetical protein [Candidatus Uhrbacteria bacterium]